MRCMMLNTCQIPGLQYLIPQKQNPALKLAFLWPQTSYKFHAEWTAMHLFVQFSMGPSLGEISFYWLELIPGEIKPNFYNSHHWCSISKTLYAKSTYIWYSSLTSYSLSPLTRKGGILSEQKSFHCHFPSK